MKILSCNVNYFLGFTGTPWDFAAHAYRGLIGGSTVERTMRSRFVELMEAEEPDVACLLEVDQGSMRTETEGQTERLARTLAEHGHRYGARSDPKYGPDKLVGHLPVFRYMANGVLWKGDADITPHYLPPGTKQLVHRVRTDDLTVYALHLPIIRHYRRKQLSGLADLIGEEEENVVVCGDFNTYWGDRELTALTDRTDLQVHVPGKTSPTAHPILTLDLFLASRNLDVTRCDTLDVHVSDHLPAVMEVEP